MHIAMLIIGNEILDGRVRDAHVQTLARALAQRACTIREVRIVADHVPTIVDALEELALRSAAVVVTGGLGATADDLTRAAVATWAQRELVESAHALERVRACLEKRRRPFAEDLRVHAHIPDSALTIDNPVGLATGFALTPDNDARAHVFVLPGMRSEFDAMVPAVVEHIVALNSAPETTSHPWQQERILVFGITERDIEARIQDIILPDGFTIGFRPQTGPVEVSIHGTGQPSDLAAVTALVTDRLRDVLVTTDGTSIPARLGLLLTRHQHTIATAESCTGGLIASMLTDVPGSSSYFMQGTVTYSNDAKQQQLGVLPETLAIHGAVSAQTVLEMATGMRARAQTDWTIAVSGIAGPGGGTPDKPVGTVHVAITGPDGLVQHHELGLFGMSRDAVKRRTALAAMVMILRALDPS